MRSERGGLTPLAVDGGRIVARTRDGVLLLRADGRRLLTFAAHAGEAALQANDLVLLAAGEARRYDARSGALRSRRDLGRAASDLDLHGGVLVYRTARAIHLLRLRDGRRRMVRTPGAAVAVELDRSGLFYAYGARGGTRVVFEPLDRVVARFG